MNKILWLITIFSLSSFGMIREKNNMVQAFQLVDYPLISFVDDYARVMKKSIIVQGDLVGKINITMNKDLDKKSFSKLFYTTLASEGYTLVDEDYFSRVIHSRDVRYTPTQFYSSDSFPNEDRYIMVFHQLKYPLSNEITRNMRPFMSRYGRIIDFNDAHSIAISDRGTNIKRLLSLINALDSKEGLKRLTKKFPQRKKVEEKDKLRTELELSRLNEMKLKKELLELKMKGDK